MLKKILIGIGTLILGLYIALCGFLYFYQESFLFHPKKLPADYHYNFEGEVEEMFITATDGVELNALLFTSDSSKGLIFYLHGNAGTLATWGDVAYNFTSRGYDVFILDYRGFGKSEGSIESEKQFFSDAQAAYDEMKKEYDESEITILGYSIGTGVATYLALTNSPQRLILQAPFYSMHEMASGQYPIVPGFLLRYPFATNEYIQKVKAPIVFLHGDKDGLIHFKHSVRLKELSKPGDVLYSLPGIGHSGWSDTPQYQEVLSQIL